ncbi:hypothetical protein FACS1894108_15770 [Planctomycetales bacterium]|nr:hypothetical protein FACS1894108_15770 [Planctomycetales bacterium]
MNTSDSYTLEDIMKASPFRENLRSAPLFDIDTFFQDFFVHDSNYDKIALDISKEIDDKPTYYDPFILLFNGYAGTGKTTFMHWFCSKYRYDKIKNSTYYKHAFLDFEKVGGPDCDYGFKEQIKSELKNVFAKICVKCEKSVEDLLNHLLDNPDEYASLESFFKVAKDFSSNKHKTRFVELFDAMEYLDLFLLLLLYYNKNEEYFIEALNGSITPETNTKRLLLVVDNLDSITVSIDARYTPNKFLSAYRKYLRIINNTSNKYFAIIFVNIHKRYPSPRFLFMISQDT